MKQLSLDQLTTVLKNTFSANATCWSEATDEIRDMCREARLLANVEESGAVNFQLMNSPSQWNVQGVEGTLRFYKMLDDYHKKQFCDHFENLLLSWQK